MMSDLNHVRLKGMYNELVQGIFESSHDGLWLIDANGVVLKVNQAAEQIAETRTQRFVGRHVEELIKEGYFGKSVALEVLRTKKRISMIQFTRNGKKVLVTGNPIFDSDGQIIFVLSNVRDLAKLNLLQEMLEKVDSPPLFHLDSNRSLAEDQRFPGVVCRSRGMSDVLERIRRVAPLDVTVLLTGESGVGKGTVCDLLHRLSPRRRGALIHVNCSSIPRSLMESELFGYEKGAFTGAGEKGKPGFFEMAQGGTLFLDEIADIPFDLQSKLLRFIEKKEIVRVGGVRQKKLNTRIVAATNQTLQVKIKRGEFREDLFFRINVVPIHVPPLRERREDIPMLVSYFLNRFNRMYGKHRKISQKALDYLCSFAFPGNVRELSNIVEQLVILSTHDCVEAEELPQHLRNEVETHALDISMRNSGLREAVKEFERRLVMECLKKYRYQTKAASILGIDQSTLSKKLKRYTSKQDVIVHR